MALVTLLCDLLYSDYLKTIIQVDSMILYTPESLGS